MTKNIDLIKVYTKLLWIDKDLKAIDLFCNEQIKTLSQDGNYIGIDYLRDRTQNWFIGFPNMNTIFLNFNNVNEDTISCDWETGSTHTGYFRSLPSTNKQIKYRGTSIYKIANNKIIEYTLNLDIKNIINNLTPYK